MKVVVLALLKSPLSMSTEQKIRLILSLNQLILRKTTGTADEIASRLGISRSTFFRLLTYMKDELNAPIKYDDCRRVYFYDRRGKIDLGFINESSLEVSELEQLNGGFHYVVIEQCPSQLAY